MDDAHQRALMITVRLAYAVEGGQEGLDRTISSYSEFLRETVGDGVKILQKAVTPVHLLEELLEGVELVHDDLARQVRQLRTYVDAYDDATVIAGLRNTARLARRLVVVGGASEVVIADVIGAIENMSRDEVMTLIGKAALFAYLQHEQRGDQE
jgi:putative NADH-flavin reductase